MKHHAYLYDLVMIFAGGFTIGVDQWSKAAIREHFVACNGGEYIPSLDSILAYRMPATQAQRLAFLNMGMRCFSLCSLLPHWLQSSGFIFARLINPACSAGAGWRNWQPDRPLSPWVRYRRDGFAGGRAPTRRTILITAMNTALLRQLWQRRIHKFKVQAP